MIAMQKRIKIQNVLALKGLFCPEKSSCIL